MNLLGDVGFDVHSRGKGVSAALENNCRNVSARFDFREHTPQLVHHREVDYIERRILQRYTRNRRIKLNLEPSCGGGRHSSCHSFGA